MLSSIRPNNLQSFGSIRERKSTFRVDESSNQLYASKDQTSSFEKRTDHLKIEKVDSLGLSKSKHQDICLYSDNKRDSETQKMPFSVEISNSKKNFSESDSEERDVFDTGLIDIS